VKPRFIKTVILLLLLLGIPLGVWRLHLAQVINKELASIRAAGLPTTGEELNRWYPAVPDNQNAALVLTQAFNLRRLYPDNRSNLIFKFKLPNRGQALSAEQIELLRGYTALNEAHLSKANEALTLPASRYPLNFSMLMQTPLPHLTGLKGLAELYQYSAYLSLESGNPSLARSNIIAILGLARTLDDEPCLISQLLRLRLFKLAFATLERRANASPFDSAETASLADAFALTRTTNMAVRALIGERAMVIPYFRMTRAEALKLNPPKNTEDSRIDSPLPCYGPFPVKVIGLYELDYGSFLIAMNKAITRLNNPPPENLRADGYLARVGEASMQRRRTISGISLSAYSHVAHHENEGIAMQRLALTALAIENFAAANRSFPEKLDELVPKFLLESPSDPFTGLELKYHRSAKGYVVYSVGPDMQDDGGLEASRKKESDDKRSYDITFTVER